MAKRVSRFIWGSTLAMWVVVPGLIGRASAQSLLLPTSDRPAGLVVFPKVVADPDDTFRQGRKVDTIVQLTNTSTTTARIVHCFYVDGTGHCSNNVSKFDSVAGSCRDNNDCFSPFTCDVTWGETNFTVVLSPRQPTGWSVSSGRRIPAPPNPDPDNQLITPASGGYFTGEVKCLEVNSFPTLAVDTALPINANDLKGEATIYEVATGNSGRVDVRSYNGIGFQSVSSNGATQANKVLCLGSTAGSTECPAAEYANCPSTLLFDHRFDLTTDPSKSVTTDITFVPCSENFATQTTEPTTLQFNVYNEFEQKLSSATRVDCFKEVQLSHIDQRVGQERFSVFNVATQGSLTGLTRIRPVTSSETNIGHGILAVAEEFLTNGSAKGSGAYNLNYSGTNTQGDFIRY